MFTHTSQKVMPYVYMCVHSQTGQFYIGSRWANLTPSTEDLGTHYFTSSKVVQASFSEYVPSIVAEFMTKEDAFAHEQLLIQEHWGSPLLINKMVTLNGKPGHVGMKGRSHTPETKWIMSMRAQGRDDLIDLYKQAKRAQHYARQGERMKAHNPGFKSGNTPWNDGKQIWSEEEKQRRREQRLGDKNPRYGLKLTDDEKEYLRQKMLSRPKLTCPHCHRGIDPANYKRYHGDKCKLNNT